MGSLDFETWSGKGKPIDGRSLPQFQKLMTTPIDKFIDTNMLINVPVKRAAKSTQPGSATLITGALYSLLVKYAGTTDLHPGFSAAPYDALLALRQFAGDEPINPLPVPKLDYLTYFLMATLHKYNPEGLLPCGGQGPSRLDPVPTQSHIPKFGGSEVITSQQSAQHSTPQTAQYSAQRYSPVS